MRSRLALGFCSAAALMFACGPRSRSESAAQSTSPNRARTTANAGKGTSSLRDKAPLLSSTLKVDVTASAAGVRFAFRVTNGGGKVEVNFPNGRTHDLVVLDTLGREVWRWSNGRIFTQTFQNKVLRTDAELAFAEEWAEPKRGRYVAVASLSSGNYPIEQRAEFIVP